MLVLVGMPGCGKSSIGKSIARRLGVECVDSDQVIESTLRCSIRAYFDSRGEAAFRDIEEEVIEQLSAAKVGVLATGGGAVLRPINRERLRARGTVIYLRAAPEQLFKRLRHDTKRPLLQGGDALRKLRDLYEARDPLYRECAHFVVDTRGSTLSMLVNRILMQLELMPTEPPSTGPPAES